MLAVKQKRAPPVPRLSKTSLPAPIMGVDSVSPISKVPPSNSLYSYNLIPSDNGLRTRLGYREWCTGLTGAADSTVRSTISFTGSQKSGSTNRLFACTSSGIWDVTASSATPTQVITFAVQNADAGYGVAHVCSTPAGRFLLYCDAENGLFIYPESGTFAAVALSTTAGWTGSTAYFSSPQNFVTNSGNIYKCTTGGISAATGGPTGTTAAITDGTVTWAYVSATVARTIGPSVADQNLGYVGNPANFAAVTVWKNRVWLVEKNTSRAWYLNINSVYGTATSFDFGSKMKAGGPLVNLYNWSYDAGGGMDTLLVGISQGGDVVIYQGTDPTNIASFGLKGVWTVGAVPYGRSIATDFGGDLLIMSLLGLVPLSKLVVGQPVVAGSRGFYATDQITPLFQNLATANQSLQGWCMAIHPTDGVLIVSIPQISGASTTQLVMSYATKGWYPYRGLPILSMATLGGQFFFGTIDGRICQNTGYVDGVALGNPNAFTPIVWSTLFPFQDGGNRKFKQVKLITVELEALTPNPYVQATAKYDFDISEPALPSSNVVIGGNTWDAATWDASVWGGDYSPSVQTFGATGIGKSVAVAVQGSAITRTTLFDVELFWEEGGFL